MKTILVATDFSDSSFNAAKYAAEMAKHLSADILLFNVFEIIDNLGDLFFHINVDDLKRNAEKDMVYFKNKLKNNVQGIDIKTEVRLGSFMDEINKISEEIKPYLLIIGSQGKTVGEKILFGGHAGIVLKNYKYPLITVPLTASYTAIKNIGIAYDFKKLIDVNFVEEIKLLADNFKANIHILNAAKEDEFDGGFILLASKLEKMFSPNPLNFHFIAGEHINESVIDYSEKNKIDLLIVMPAHKSLWKHLTVGSHTKQMVLHSHVPVFSLSE